MPLQVDAGRRVEEHALLRVHLQQEVLERRQADPFEEPGLLLVAEAVQLAQLLPGLAGLLHHLVHQVVGVHHGALSALHLPAGQVHHAVAQVEELLGPGVPELLQDQEQHLEVVVLLVAHGVHHAGEVRELPEALDGRADVLRHVHRRAVAPQQQLLVQPVAGEVAPHAAIVLAEEDALLQALQHLVPAQLVGVALVVQPVEVDPHAGVGGVEALVHPAVHGLPEIHHLRVAGLPLAEHLLGGQQDRGLLLGLLLGHATGHQLLHLGLEGLVEGHVVLPDQLVALQPAAFRRFAVAEALPGEHALADVDAPVVDHLHLHHLVPGGLQDAADAVAQEVVAQVPQVQGLVGVGRTVLDHGAPPGIREGQDVGRSRPLQEAQPVAVGDHQVQEALDHVEALHFGHLGLQVLPHGLRGLLRTLAALLQEGEHVDGDIPLELGPGGLEGDAVGRDVRPEQGLKGFLNGRTQRGL